MLDKLKTILRREPNVIKYTCTGSAAYSLTYSLINVLSLNNTVSLICSSSFLGNILKVTGARLIDEDDEKELESMGGGYPNALDVCELYHESRVIDAVREWKEAAAGHEALSGRHEKSILETR